MGWFWQSSSTPKPDGSSASPTSASAAPVPPPATSITPAQTPSTQPEPASTTSTDREMAMFMQMFMQDTQASSQPKTTTSTLSPPTSPSSNPTTTTTSSSSSWLPWPFSKSTSSEPTATTTPTATTPPKPSRSPQSLAMSEHVLPTTMSCRDAFDYAWHCHTPGAQWNAVYRYGSVRTCSELWDDFWFCMRTKSFSPEMKAEAIRQHYRAKEEAKYGGGRPSSEDIWESREERLPPGTAFQAKFEPPIVDDAEFQRADAERRRRIREMVGVDGKGSDQE